jgi:hypothetical protein
MPKFKGEKDFAPAAPGWELVGSVCIDTGTILLSDPVRAEDATNDNTNFDDLANNKSDFTKLDGDNSLAVLTGVGDGRYPVYVRRATPHPALGERIVEIKIDCLPPNTQEFLKGLA